MNQNQQLVALSVSDISAFCKQLRGQLDAAKINPLPSHLGLLNMLARSAGHRNFQALRSGAKISAASEAQPVTLTSTPPPSAKALAMPSDAALSRTLKRAVTHFDTAGHLMRWPSQFAVQQQALWALWVRFPAKREMTETQVNETLNSYHRFGDPATLRRELVEAKFLSRTLDCRSYRKEARRPDTDSVAFLKLVVSNKAVP
jgi:hypothetical protein